MGSQQLAGMARREGRAARTDRNDASDGVRWGVAYWKRGDGQFCRLDGGEALTEDRVPRPIREPEAVPLDPAHGDHRPILVDGTEHRVDGEADGAELADGVGVDARAEAVEERVPVGREGAMVAEALAAGLLADGERVPVAAVDAKDGVPGAHDEGVEEGLEAGTR